MNKRKCTLCKNFDKYKEFNCLYFKIKIEDPEVATKCTNFIPKRKESRKPCKDCIYYVRNPKVFKLRRIKLFLIKDFIIVYALISEGLILERLIVNTFQKNYKGGRVYEGIKFI